MVSDEPAITAADILTIDDFSGPGVGKGRQIAGIVFENYILKRRSEDFSSPPQCYVHPM